MSSGRTRLAAWRGSKLTVAAVTQRELGQYLELGEQARRHRVLRDELLARLASGARVEPGPLVAQVEHSARRVLSARALAGVLGEERVRELREAVEPTLHRHLIVSRG